MFDQAKYADLPWDFVFTGELLGSYKPYVLPFRTFGIRINDRIVYPRDPKVYLSAMHHLSLTPEKCVMVAAHIYDLRAAASLGMKTVYVRRVTEDIDERELVRIKSEGGEVDLIVDSLLELADIMKAT